MIKRLQIPTHENTVISKANAKIESDLSYKLNAVTTLIRETIKNNPSIHTVDELKTVTGLNKEVSDIIRAAVQKSYQLGTDYVTKIANAESLITTSDLMAIRDMSDSFTARFWGRVQKQIFDLKIPLLSQLTEEMLRPNDKFSSNYIVNSLSIAITTMALNQATITKAASLLPSKEVTMSNQTGSSNVLAASNEYAASSAPPSTVQAAARELTAASTFKSLSARTRASLQRDFPGANISVSGTYPNDTITIEMPSVVPQVPIVYMWSATIDERTCPLCVSLHGRTWTMNESSLIPEIPDQTHYNCRCRVMLVESDFAAQIAEEQATGQ